MINQTLDARYVDKEKLAKMLKDTFGVGQFRVQVDK